jgi:carboxymethylenebutenolidase
METTTREQQIDGRLVVTVRPVGPGPWPGVVMLHEAFGLEGNVRRQAERLASVGYLVLVPDLMGRGPWLRCVRAVFRSLTAQQGRPFALIDACRDELRADPDCTGKVGVIGFCMGGGFALVSAGRGFDASAVNYGMIPDNLEEVLGGACPVVASYGGRDKALMKQVPQLREALLASGVTHDLKVYPTAGHAFLNDSPAGPLPLRPLMKIAHVGPEPTAAADAWRRIEDFFAAHLGG